VRVLHLFAGAGGGVLADRLLGFRSVGYVEIEPYCQAVLKAKIEDGFIDLAPIFGDVRDFIRNYVSLYRGRADVVAGGFPCQPFSVAGKRKGSADNRNLWPEFAAVVREVRPRYVFAENVPGLLSWDGGRYFGKIIGDLAALGYGVRWTVLGASDVGAPHRRKRLWLLADASGRESRCGSEQLQGREPIDGQSPLILPVTGGGSGEASTGCNSWWSLDPADLPDTTRERWPTEEQSQPDVEHDGQEPSHGSSETGGWPTESRVGRVAHGVAHRVDRLRAIGNGQVPAVAATAWRLLSDHR
jgi:DNA (cytosine-5)-methyltransferase 1